MLYHCSNSNTVFMLMLNNTPSAVFLFFATTITNFLEERKKSTDNLYSYVNLSYYSANVPLSFFSKRTPAAPSDLSPELRGSKILGF